MVAVGTVAKAVLACLRKFYCQLAAEAETVGGIKESHSLDDAREITARKAKVRKSAMRPAKTQSAA